MLNMEAYKDEDIIYNEEKGLYELYVNGGTFYASGTWESCLAALRKFYMDDPECAAEDEELAGDIVNDFLYVKHERDGIGDYQLEQYTEAVQDVADEIEYVAQFGIDVLQIMSEAREALMGEDMETRREIKIGAYDKLRELIDKKAAELWEE